MREPTVRVSVSLIERIDSAYNASSDTLAALIEQLWMLSQPEPNVEQVPYNGHNGLAVFADAARRLNEGRAPAAPPSITDMAPGTTFTATAPSEIWRWSLRSDGLAVSAAGVWPLASFDPSTIRDVTPPREDT